MPVGHLLGLFEKAYQGFEWMNKKILPENLVYIGIRDLDDFEKSTIRNLNIKAYTMLDIEHKGGMRNVLEEAFQYLKIDKGQNPLHVSFDVDALSGDLMQYTGTPVRNGLTYREANYLMHRVSALKCMVGLDITEFNPLFQNELYRLRDHKEISELKNMDRQVGNVVDMILYGFGKNDL